MVEKIVDTLAVTLTQGEEQRLRRRGTSNVDAYESWLRARELLTRGTRELIAQARAMYRRAIEFDLNFAAPHAGLALAAISDYVSGWASDPAQALDEAERWAGCAVNWRSEPVRWARTPSPERVVEGGQEVTKRKSLWPTWTFGPSRPRLIGCVIVPIAADGLSPIRYPASGPGREGTLECNSLI